MMHERTLILWEVIPRSLFILFVLSTFDSAVDAAVTLERIESRSASPAPISVTPSQDWDGNDGPWSTFSFQIGTPPQTVKLLVSTASSQTWAVAPEGCGSGDPTNCAQLRGGEYNWNTSTTWVPNLANPSTQLYYLTLESDLGYGGKGIYGFDDITLGFQGTGGPTLKNQSVAGIATKQYYMGIFGLTPRETNFTSDGNAIPSLMENLRAQSMIPSISWGYTAGNQYRLSQVLGSLTLGGCDTSRFIPNNFSVPLSPDVDKDLTVSIEGINTDTGVSLLSSPIMAFLDSTIPYLYLPISICTLFENAFGLIWNDTSQLYSVNTTQHIFLQTQNPNVTFTLGSNYTSSKINITLPYAAFDLTASYPLVNTTARYFPLQRAENETQYTLGRTFFQEAYIIVDYERKNFSVSQCKWVEAPQHIVAILPPPNSTVNPETSHHLPTGAIAGISVGGGLLVLVAILLYLFWWRPFQRKRRAVELGTHGSTRPQQEFVKPELEGSNQSTLLSRTTIFETEGSKVAQAAEMGTQSQIHEMPVNEEVATEIEGVARLAELDGRREIRWSWVRGDSRLGNSGRRGEMSLGSPDEGTMSSLSSGMGSLGSRIVSPESPAKLMKKVARGK